MGTRVWAAPATWFSTPQFQEIFLELQNEGKSQVEAFFFSSGGNTGQVGTAQQGHFYGRSQMPSDDFLRPWARGS